MNADPQPSRPDAKGTLRRSMRERLRSMEHDKALASSRSITGHLGALLADLEGPVLSFAPIRRSVEGVERVEEVDLGQLHDALIARGTLALPRIDWEKRTMHAWRLPRADRVDPMRDLETRRFDVPEPAHGERVGLHQLGAVLVPGLAFDRSGARLGRGAGFYDRFLEPLKAQTHLIGVCFECQLVDEVPTESHDRRVASIVTESGVITCDASGL